MIFVETEKYVDFLVKHKMTPNQFMFCYLKATYNMTSFRKYIKGVQHFKAEEIKDLIERGYIEDFNEKNPNGTRQDFIDSYLITPKFHKEIFVETEQAGEELWATFPSFLIINSNRVSAKSCDKDVLIKTYCKRIKNNKKIHEEVLSLLKQAIERNEIRMGIEKWVGSEQWNVLKDAYKDNGGKLNYGEQEFS
jgi:hypothetical protein